MQCVQHPLSQHIVYDWLSKLERYFCVSNFLDIKEIAFSLLKDENHVKLTWEVYAKTKESQVSDDEH